MFKTSRILSAALLSWAAVFGTVVFGTGATPASAQEPIKIGSIVHFQNQYAEGQFYLDTRGRVMDKREFADVKENVFVSTHPSSNRDNGSGSWKIVSADGQADGTPLKFGNKIHLLNMYPNAGYLDVWGTKLDSIYHPATVNQTQTDYTVFTSTSKSRENGSGTWIVTPSNPGQAGKEVFAGNNIWLESGLHQGHFLETNGAVVHPKLPFKEYEGSKFLVFTSDKEGFHSNSQVWKITPSKASAQ